MAKKLTNAKLAERLLNSEKSILKTKYIFNIGDKVIYKGGLHEKCKNCICTIMERNNKKHRIDYTVKFEDGNVIRCILEKVLELVIDDSNENINKNEENNDD